MTNAHVVNGAPRVQVVLPDSGTTGSLEAALSKRATMVPARIIGVSRELDLGVIKVEAGKLPALPLANYRKLSQGEMVCAFVPCVHPSAADTCFLTGVRHSGIQEGGVRAQGR